MAMGKTRVVFKSQKTAAFGTGTLIITANSTQPCFHAQLSSLVSVCECNAPFSVSTGLSNGCQN